MYDRLLAHPLYAALCRASDAGEGNLLQHTDRATAAAQIATISWVVGRYGPPTTVIEVGTNKALFGYLLLSLFPVGHPFDYYTIDPDSRAADAASVLGGYDRHIHNIAVHAHLGRSQEVLPELLSRIPTPDLAWVDGEHTEEAVVSDLTHLAGAGTRIILIDDVRLLAEVRDGFLRWRASDAAVAYRIEEVPFPDDRRGIAIAIRRETDGPEQEADDA